VERIFDKAMWVVAAAALAGLIVAVLNYFGPHNGIDHTEGALLVVISTALMLVAAVLLYRLRPIRVLVDILIVLDIIGTGFAAYLLETYLLLALMVIALLGWLAHHGRRRYPRIGSQPGTVA
jgi:hypothetical protein